MLLKITNEVSKFSKKVSVQKYISYTSSKQLKNKILQYHQNKIFRNKNFKKSFKTSTVKIKKNIAEGLVCQIRRLID